MEVAINQKFIHISPRKLRLLADMVRKMTPDKAVETLRFIKKDATKDLISAIKTALASAKQKGMEGTIFKSMEINEGPRLKRFKASPRGRARPFKRRMSHIKIVLSDEGGK